MNHHMITMIKGDVKKARLYSGIAKIITEKGAPAVKIIPILAKIYKKSSECMRNEMIVITSIIRADLYFFIKKRWVPNQPKNNHNINKLSFYKNDIFLFESKQIILLK